MCHCSQDWLRIADIPRESVDHLDAGADEVKERIASASGRSTTRGAARHPDGRDRRYIEIDPPGRATTTSAVIGRRHRRLAGLGSKRAGRAGATIAAVCRRRTTGCTCRRCSRVCAVRAGHAHDVIASFATTATICGEHTDAGERQRLYVDRTSRATTTPAAIARARAAGTATRSAATTDARTPRRDRRCRRTCSPRCPCCLHPGWLRVPSHRHPASSSPPRSHRPRRSCRSRSSARSSMECRRRTQPTDLASLGRSE